MSVRNLVKVIALCVGRVVVAPIVVSFTLRSWITGRDAAIEGSSQALALLPGRLGILARRAFYSSVLANCHHSVTIGFGTVFSKAHASIGRNVYIGVMCHLGWIELGDDVLLASGVHIPSGPATHGIERLDVPIRLQPGQLRCVRIGSGTWVGSNAIILADVGEHCVVAAGAVVTVPVADFSIVAGVPARVVRDRRSN